MKNYFNYTYLLRRSFTEVSVENFVQVFAKSLPSIRDKAAVFWCFSILMLIGREGKLWRNFKVFVKT